MNSATKKESTARDDLFCTLRDARVNGGNFHIEWNAELELFGIWAAGDIIGSGATIDTACRDAIRTVKGWS